MKKTILSLLLAGGLVLVGCQEENNGPGGSGSVSQQTADAFAERYPNAANVQWNPKNDYTVASFRDGGVNASAWYDQQGGWYMTETDIPYDALPEAVKTAFKGSKYASWRVDDVDKIERQGAETVYVLEVENGTEEYDLYYTPTGELSKVEADRGEEYDYEDFIPGTLPAEVQTYMDQHYPEARLIEIDVEDGFLEVEVIEGRTVYSVRFDQSNQWYMTETDLPYESLPAAVKTAFEGSKYASWRVDDVDKIERSGTETVYVLEVEDKATDSEVGLYYTETGVLTREVVDVEDDYDYDDVRPATLPEAVTKYLTETYPQARVVDVDFEQGRIEVELVEGRTVRDVLFEQSTSAWIQTVTEVNAATELPQAVRDAVAKEYAGYVIDDAELVEKADGTSYYEVELENKTTDRELTLRIKTDGTIL